MIRPKPHTIFPYNTQQNPCRTYFTTTSTYIYMHTNIHFPHTPYIHSRCPRTHIIFMSRERDTTADLWLLWFWSAKCVGVIVWLWFGVRRLSVIAGANTIWWCYMFRIWETGKVCGEKGREAGGRQCVNPHGVRYMVYGGLWMRKHNIRSQQKYIQKQSSGVADEK